MGGDAEKGVLGLIVAGGGSPIGEVAAPASRDQNLLAYLVSVLQNEDTASPFSCLQGTHQTSRPRADDDYVVALHSSPVAAWAGCRNRSAAAGC